MKHGKVNLGQIEAALNKLGGEDGLQRLLAGELKVVPTKAVTASHSKFLVRDGSFSAVTLGEHHDPDRFYQNRNGLYVWPDFRERVVSAAGSTEAGTKFKKVSRFKLVTDVTGEQLKSERSESVWTAKDFCAWLAAKLQKQPGGEQGELLSTGWATLFLVEGINGEVFVVGVYWFSASRGWSIYTWPLGDTWNVGRSFASRN